MENQAAHNSQAVLQQLSDLHIHPIWLPAQSTHFLQPLDLIAFTAPNKHDMNLRSRRTQKGIEGKLLRALQARHQP
jgi:hypothetical protein